MSIWDILFVESTDWRNQRLTEYNVFTPPSDEDGEHTLGDFSYTLASFHLKSLLLAATSILTREILNVIERLH